ncbi:MAG: GGDEF domain-containing protein [Methylobacter sp.]|nr:GGDEF domain-containing protein [Methylobacter sp.]
MAAPKYFESSVRSKELLKLAITFLGIHRLSANPVNYTVCYEYLLGNQPLLKQKIEKTIAEKIQLTDPMMETWFNTFLSGYDQASLKQSKADLVDIISKLMESTSLTEAQVSQFDQTLRHSEKALINANSPLESIVVHLLASTQSMQAKLGIMTQQIQASQREINSLQERLGNAIEEALSDPLTGLINRKGFARAIEEAVLSVGELISSPCLLMMDIDHFKKINDTFGHLMGDRVIKVVSNILTHQIKGKDTAARYGGEEFCVLLPETELTDAVKVAETIRRTIEKTRIKRASDHQDISQVTISIGVACYQPDEPITAFFERADRALYHSKHEGRNRVTFFVD